MTNDTNTVSGALQECIEHLENNLSLMGVDVTYSSADGIIGLIDEITNIAPSVGGGNCETIPTTVYLMGSDDGTRTTLICGLLPNYSKGGVSLTTGSISNVTLNIKEGQTIVDTFTTSTESTQVRYIDNIPYGNYNYSIEFDGSGTIFDSSSKSIRVLANHNYAFSFSKNEYNMSGNSVTIECTLTDRGLPLSSETVTFTDQNNNSTTSTTDSNGVASLIVTTESTITASWDNLLTQLSTQCDVVNYDFYDNCSIDNTSDYTSINNSMDFTLRDDETYRLYNTSTGLKGVKTNQTFGKDVIIDFDFKPLASSTDVFIGLYDFNLNNGYRTLVYGRSSSDYLRIITGAYTSYTGSQIGSQSLTSQISNTSWYNIYMEIRNNSITTSLYKYSSDKSTKTLQKTVTATGALNMGDANNVIIQAYNSAGTYIDNIKVKEL